KGFGFIYHCLVFIPLGFILAALARGISTNLLSQALLLVSVASLVSAILEVTLTSIRGGALNTGNLLVGTFVIIGSGWVLHHLLLGRTFNHGHPGWPQGLDQPKVEIG